MYLSRIGEVIYYNMLTVKLISHSRIQTSIRNRSWYQIFRNFAPKFSEHKMGSNQDGESCTPSKDEQLKDSTVNEKTQADFSNMSLNSLNTESGEESNAVPCVSSDDPSGRVKKKDLFSDIRESTLAANYNLMGYPTPIFNDDVFERRIYHKVFHKKEFPYIAFLGFGLANFMSYAAHFCKYEVQNKEEIISIGSGNGMVDREIISTYHKHFGEEIKITLVDPNPDYEVDFKTVDDLLEARPEAVGNCVLLIIWPEPMGRNDGYDINAIRKLQPPAALVLYDPTEVSASEELTGFLRYKTKETVGCGYSYDEHEVALENYAVEKVTGLEVYCKAGDEVEAFGIKMAMEPAVRHWSLRLLKLRRLYLK